MQAIAVVVAAVVTLPGNVCWSGDSQRFTVRIDMQLTERNLECNQMDLIESEQFQEIMVSHQRFGRLSASERIQSTL